MTSNFRIYLQSASPLNSVTAINEKRGMGKYTYWDISRTKKTFTLKQIQVSSVLYSFPIFGNIAENLHKGRYQRFLVFSNYAIYFLKNCLQKQILCLKSWSPWNAEFFDIFNNFKIFLKQVSIWGQHWYLMD